MKTTVRADIQIARPPEDVTRVLLDPARAVLWTTDLERFEVVAGGPGEVGSKARLHYRQNGRPYVMEDTLLEAESNRRYLSRVSGEALIATVETTLTPCGDGTRVAIRWTGMGRALPLRLFLPFMRAVIAHQTNTDLRRLKALVEGSTAAPS